MPNRDYDRDYDPMRETWHNRSVRGADWGTRHPWLAAVGIYSSTVLAGVLAVLAVVAMVVAAWQVGWILKTENAKRQGTINNIQSHNYVHNYGYQQTQREAVTSDMNEVRQIGPQMIGQPEQERQALGSQRVNAVMTLCDDASKVDPSQGPLPDAAFIAANCSGSVINPASPYETQQDNPTPK